MNNDLKSLAQRLMEIAKQMEEVAEEEQTVIGRIAEENDSVIGYMEFDNDMRSHHIDVTFPDDVLGVGQINIGSELIDEGYYIQTIAKDPATPHGPVSDDETVYRLFINEL